MIEAAAEANEDLVTRYLEGHTLSVNEIEGLRERTRGEIVPMLCSWALTEACRLDAVIDDLHGGCDIPP